MSESLKRVSMVLLALAITLGLSGVLTLGLTNNAKASSNGTIKVKAPSDEEYSNANQPQIEGCDVVVAWFGFDEGERSTTVKFESKSPTQNTLVSPLGFQGPYSFTGNGTGNTLDFNKTFTLSFKGDPHPQKGYKVKVTTKTDQNETKKKTTKTKVFWVKDCDEQEPEKDYLFQFAKKWEGDDFDKTNVEVTFTALVGGKPFSWTVGDAPVEVVPGETTLVNLQEEVTGLPTNCKVTETDPVFPVKSLTAPSDLSQYVGEGRVFTYPVTNTVDCEEPRQPVTPEGETETPVTPAGTTTQVTATPTGAVDAGAGANLVASLAGLMSSAAVVAAGVFIRKFTVVSL